VKRSIQIGTAREIAREVGRAVSTWREEAAALGLTQRQIDRMAISRSFASTFSLKAIRLIAFLPAGVECE
jgi:hypothetical protein